MSKPTRRRQRPGTQPPITRPAGSTPSSTAGTAADSARPAATSGTAGTPTRPVGATHVRAGRRERQRTTYKPSFLERYRTLLFLAAAVVGVILIGGFVFASASSAAYACTQEWVPSPTPSPAPSATQNLGYVQPDMGHNHVTVGEKVTYTYCPPASGRHYNRSGAGPIAARVYGPNDTIIPEGWIHNLEHGAMVILYIGTGEGATTDGQAKLKALYDGFPPGPVCGTAKGSVGPVIARFDQMATPYAAIVWGRVLPLDTFDADKIVALWNQWGERTNPENQCPNVPRTSPSPGTSEAPSPGTSEAPSAAPSTSPSTSPSTAPSSTAPSPAPSDAAPSPS